MQICVVTCLYAKLARFGNAVVGPRRYATYHHPCLPCRLSSHVLRNLQVRSTSIAKKKGKRPVCRCVGEATSSARPSTLHYHCDCYVRTWVSAVGPLPGCRKALTGAVVLRTRTLSDPCLAAIDERIVIFSTVWKGVIASVLFTWIKN